MYVTEQLPSSTYDPPASTLAKALPNLKPAKRHTIDGIVNKAFSWQKSKENNYLSLNKSDRAYKLYKPQEDDEDEHKDIVDKII